VDLNFRFGGVKDEAAGQMYSELEAGTYISPSTLDEIFSAWRAPI